MPLAPVPESRLPPSIVCSALAAIDRAHPIARKLLVAPDINWGREALVALARHTGGWVGWEAATLRSLAADLALVPLEARRTRIAGDVEIAALTDRALAAAVEAREVAPGFAALAGGLGFRRATHDAAQELRAAGVSPAQLRSRVASGTPASDLAAVLARYETLLAAERLADAAAVFHAALDAFDAEAPFTLDALIVMTPDLRGRGLAGRLAARLRERGAVTLPVEPAAAPPRADRSLFAAATAVDEIREVLRRAVAAGARWDEVEIVTTDPDTYGLALDAAASHCGIPYSFLTGLSLATTRVGRAVEHWLSWISDGLPADTLREALDTGDIAAPGAEMEPAALARRFRSLGIGWGRARYEAAIGALRQVDAAAHSGEPDDEDPSARAARAARADERRRVAAALADLLERILAFTPEVPERGSDRPVRTSVGALAHATMGWLDLVEPGGAADQRTFSRLRGRVTALLTMDQEESFGAALAGLRDGLSDLRAWTDASAARKPWSSGGGAVHLTDIGHGGITGRPHVYVVGLDADRVTGQRVQDPMLNDATRTAVDPENLPTTSVRREERARDLAHLMDRLPGGATLSYAVSDADGRSAGPAHQFLHAFRESQRNPSLDYDDLRVFLGRPGCAVPGRPGAALDGREAWLTSLADGDLLLDGEAQVRAAYPALDFGLRAAAAAEHGDLSRYHGLVAAAAGRLDPRHSRRPLSASSLELLARCPLSWFYRYGLEIHAPDDPAYDPEAWLDARERGRLLHALFERFTRDYLGRQSSITGTAAHRDILAHADTALAEWRARVPPPSEAVFDTEAAEIRESALAFLETERQALASGDTGRWMTFELRFGWDRPVELPLEGGPLAVYGYVDRVDDLGGRRLRVIDYKTGSPSKYRQDQRLGPFNAGRNLQAAVYAAGAEASLGGTAAVFEYRFPTVRGDGDPVVYTRREFDAAGGIIGQLLAHVTTGEYVPTTECSDCRYCEHGPVCRVTTDRWHKVSSGRAEWAAEHAPGLSAYAAMLARRSAGR